MTMTTTKTKTKTKIKAKSFAISLWVSVSAQYLPPVDGWAGLRSTTGDSRSLGDDLPLPLPVKTPQDMGFKSATERQYLIFNLMAGGKLAFQRGDYATAADKWENLLRIPGLDPQIERVVSPFLNDARAKAGKPGVRIKPPSPPSRWSPRRSPRRNRPRRAAMAAALPRDAPRGW